MRQGGGTAGATPPPPSGARPWSSSNDGSGRSHCHCRCSPSISRVPRGPAAIPVTGQGGGAAGGPSWSSKSTKARGFSFRSARTFTFLTSPNPAKAACRASAGAFLNAPPPARRGGGLPQTRLAATHPRGCVNSWRSMGGAGDCGGGQAGGWPLASGWVSYPPPPSPRPGKESSWLLTLKAGGRDHPGWDAPPIGVTGLEEGPGLGAGDEPAAGMKPPRGGDPRTSEEPRSPPWRRGGTPSPPHS